MQGIEIITIIIALCIVSLPIVLKFLRKKKKDECNHICNGCGKQCPFKNIKNINID